MLTCETADNTIRWTEGERLDHLFEQRCDQLHGAGNGSCLAVIADNATLTFRDLDNRANQVARVLIDHGLTAGDRIGLMFDKTADAYVALLAVMKINAAYVPLDGSFPNERIGFILKDAEAKAIISMSQFRGKLAASRCRSCFSTRPRRKSQPSRRPARRRRRNRRRSISSPTSSTPPAPPARPRALRSSTLASAISCGWRPRSTASAKAIALIRA